MNHFTIAVADPSAVPFIRQLLLSLPQVQVLEEPALSAEEEAREAAAAQAAYERAKAEPDKLVFPPWEEVQQVLREGREG